MFCQKCGAEMPDGTKFCPSCGAPTEAGPAIQPQKKKKKGHPVLVTILVILGVFVLIGAIAGGGDKPEKVNGGDLVAATEPKEPETVSGGNTTAEAEPTEPEKVSDESIATEAQPTEPDGFTVGDTVELRDVYVTLVKVSENNGGNYMTPSDGKVFVVCEFEIENNSSKDIAVSSIVSFEAYFDDYSTSMNLSAMLSTEKPQLDGTIAAGKKMNGVIGYEVDPDWKNLEIRFTPDFWAGKDITFTYSK